MLKFLYEGTRRVVYKELEQKGWLNYADVPNSSDSGLYGKMYNLISAGQLANTEAARNAYLRAAEYRNTDWFDLLFSNALQHNHSVRHRIMYVSFLYQFRFANKFISAFT